MGLILGSGAFIIIYCFYQFFLLKIKSTIKDDFCDNDQLPNPESFWKPFKSKDAALLLMKNVVFSLKHIDYDNSNEYQLTLHSSLYFTNYTVICSVTDATDKQLIHSLNECVISEEIRIKPCFTFYLDDPVSFPLNIKITISPIGLQYGFKQSIIIEDKITEENIHNIANGNSSYFTDSKIQLLMS
jgi:hypothetical protein